MRILLSIIMSVSAVFVFAQGPEIAGPSSNGLITNVIYVPSLADQLRDGTFIHANEKDEIDGAKPKTRDGNRVVPGKGTPIGDDPLYQLQKDGLKFPSNPPSLVFDADPSSINGPSDPTGVVGPNHYLAAWNFGFRIFNKDGIPQVPEASLATVLTGNSLGDPIVMYDKWADRFIITEFDSSPNGFEMAICAGPDPVNDGWYVYQAQFTTGNFPDYTKFSIWSDGYYVTANVNNGDNGDRVWVVERDQVLTGQPAQYVGFPLPGINTSGFYSPQVFNVTGGDLPPAGNATVVYMADNSWFGVSTDHLKLWTVNVDWDNINSSTISGADQLSTAPFNGVFDGGNFSNLPQPSGPDIDCMQATIMNLAQFRSFPSHNSAVFNFVVDALGPGELAAVRWYELRQDDTSSPWVIYQEGTYTSPVGGKHAFAASMAMDSLGNIGMGYSTVSSTESIAVQYTGRMAGDPLNMMTVDETLIAQSSGNNPTLRYADYIHLSVDPVDEETFWHISEYFNNNRRDVVGVFKLAPYLNTDVGVISIDAPINGTLGASESVTITVRNYGIDVQSDIPVSYQIDGGTIESGVVPGPIASGGNEQYTFAATGDLSTEGQIYSISASTLLPADEDNSNDAVISEVTHLDLNDVGVTAITAPVSDPDLGATEAVTVTIQNFGGASQTGFDVSYAVNAGTPVIENVAGVVDGDSQISYTFSASTDMFALGTYDVTATTLLGTDSDNSNDSFMTTVNKTLCQPAGDCESFDDGMADFSVAEIDNPSGCDDNAYGDYTDLEANFEQGGTYDLTITTGYGNTYVVVWIDFNDNFVFEANEIVVDNYVIAPDQAAGTFTETMPLVIPADAAIGQHIMRAKTNWNEDVPQACDDVTYGETEDYTANITTDAVGLDENALGSNNLVISTLADHQYTIRFSNPSLNRALIFSVYNTTGQTLVQNWIYPVNGLYEYDLDMSYAAPGAYLIRLGDQNGAKVKRIVKR